MSEAKTFSWSQISGWRRECHARFGSILDMPVAQDWVVEFQRLLKPDSRVLDVGAGRDKTHRKHLTGEGQRYFSLDVDPAGEFDYRSFDEVPAGDTFDVMLCNQVFEHLSIAESASLLTGAFAYLASGGFYLATVPNVAHPVRYWADVTHITHWPVGDFYGLFRSIGFEVDLVARTNKKPLPRNPLKRFIVLTVAQGFRMDWCDTLLILARKP